MKLNGRITRVENLSPENFGRMFRLMQECYANVDRNSFEQDLSHKRWVILVCDPTGEIQGFSTQTIIETCVENRSVAALFSGDTVVSPEYWGKNPLFQIWGQFALSLIDQLPSQELYWLLISKGFRTYRILPLFFQQFWPRFDRQTPPAFQQIINRFGEQAFPNRFDTDVGVIFAGAADYHLHEGIADINEQRKTNPHLRFFEQLNPGHARGDELCCLAPLTRENFRPAAYRVIGHCEAVEL